MLKYLYSNSLHKAKINTIIEHKIVNDNYTNKFYIRSSLIDDKTILLIDNNYTFFLLNKKNIIKYLFFFKEKNILGKTLQFKDFFYFKKKNLAISFFIKKLYYKSSISYLKILFLIKKKIKNNINLLLFFVNKGNFIYFLNGLKGFLLKKKFNKLKKIFKKFKNFKFLKQNFFYLLKNHKKLIIKSLFLKNLKTKKIYIFKNKYKN